MAEIFPPPIPKAAATAAQGHEATTTTPLDKAITNRVIPALAGTTAVGAVVAPQTTSKVAQYALGYSIVEGKIVPKPIALLYAAPQPFGVVPPQDFDLRPGFLNEVLPDFVPHSSMLQNLPRTAPEVQAFHAEREKRLGPNPPAIDPLMPARLLQKSVNAINPVAGTTNVLKQINQAPPGTSNAVQAVLGESAGDLTRFLIGELRGTNQGTQRTIQHPFLPDIKLPIPTPKVAPPFVYTGDPTAPNFPTMEALLASLEPKKVPLPPLEVQPVNDAGRRNQEAAHGINRELVHERADP